MDYHQFLLESSDKITFSKAICASVKYKGVHGTLESWLSLSNVIDLYARAATKLSKSIGSKLRTRLKVQRNSHTNKISGVECDGGPGKEAISGFSMTCDVENDFLLVLSL